VRGGKHDTIEEGREAVHGDGTDEEDVIWETMDSTDVGGVYSRPGIAAGCAGRRLQRFV
jgi:hypothetical protein